MKNRASQRVVRAVFAAALVAGCGSAWAEVIINVDAGNGLVSIDGRPPSRLVSKSVEPGTKVTLSYQASDEPSIGFYQWEGLPVSVYPFNTNVTVTANADMTVNVKEGGVVYVTTDGDDETGNGTRSNPFASLQRAMMAVEEFGEIRVGGGLYVGNLTNSAAFKLVKNVSFKGSYNDNWVQDYRNSRTILASRGSNGTTTKRDRDCIYLHAVQTNRLDGFDVTCGYDGIVAQGENFNGTARKVFGPYTHTFVTHCIITNNAYHGLYHNVNLSGDGDYGFAVASSLIAFNNGYGVSVKNDQDTTSHCRYYNCTIVSNKSHGVYGYGTFQNRLSNSIVAFNGLNGSSNDLNPGTDGCKMYLANMCAYGAKGGAQGGKAGAYVPSDEFIADDPKFTGFFELSAASLCNKRGADLSEDQWLPVDTDLYGTPWNGEYDVGCIKSEHPKVAVLTYDEVWVSGEGNDDNAGDSEDAPLKTLVAAGRKLNAGGTVHLGAGTYKEGLTMMGDGSKVLGAGPDKVFLSMSGGAGFSVLGHSALIEGVSISGASYGIKLGSVEGISVTNVTVRNCVIRNCPTAGFYMAQDNVNNVPYTNFVSHCEISGCNKDSYNGYGIRCEGVHSGTSRRGSLLVDNSLIVNNLFGCHSDMQPPSGGKNEAVFVNCTIADNPNAGVKAGTNFTLWFVNSALTGNGSKNIETAGGSVINLRNTIVNAFVVAGDGVVNVDSYPTQDPMLDADYRPTEKSLCNKNGDDLSGARPEFLTSLGGEAWSGAYDIGCYKSAYPKWVPPTYADVYVATDGDDENEGNAPDVPLKTLGAAQMKIREGGTLHLGEGTFSGNWTLVGDGAKMLGAGCDKTVLQVPTGSGAEVQAHGALVEGITFTGGSTGVSLVKCGLFSVTNVTVRNCVMRNCSKGFYMAQDNENGTPYTNFVSHCVISNCMSHGIHAAGIHSGSNRRGNLLVDTTLITGNKKAYYSDFQPPSGTQNQHVFANCTVVNNQGGLEILTNLKLFLRNTIVAGNGTSNLAKNSGSTITVDHSLVTVTSTGVTLIDGRADIPDIGWFKFDTREGRKYHLTAESPACRYGSRKHLLEDPAVDLDGKALRSRRPDAGCYFSDPIGLMLYVR